MTYKEFRSENNSFKIRSLVDPLQPDKLILIIKTQWVPTVEIKMTKSDIVKLVEMLTSYQFDPGQIRPKHSLTDVSHTEMLEMLERSLWTELRKVCYDDEQPIGETND